MLMNSKEAIVCLLCVSAAAAAAPSGKPLSEFFENDRSNDPTATTPATGRSAGQAVAEVNGAPISEQTFLETLYQTSGLKILRHLIALEAARQLAESQGVQVTEEDFNQELHRIVEQLGPEVNGKGRLLSDEDRRRILRLLLTRRNMSYEEFTMGVKRQAYLRAVAQKQAVVTEEMLQEEYTRQYGPQRQISVIVVDDLELAQRIHNELQAGESFDKLAIKHSTDMLTGPAGGAMGTIAENDTRVPAIVREIAFKLEEGAYSTPIRDGDQYWVIRTDKKIAPRPIEFDKVKDEMRTALTQRLEQTLMVKLQEQMLKDSKIAIHDKRLKGEFDEWFRTEILKPSK